MMAVLDILKMGHPTLKLVASRVEEPNAPDISALAGDMRDTLEDIGGAGLAAPQVDVSLRLVVYRVAAERIPPGASQEPVDWTTMVNPVVTPLTVERRHIWERCLSIPDFYGRVARHTRVRVDFQTLKGEFTTRVANGFHAMILQHECDHLDGVLYPMRMDDLSQLTYASEFVKPGAIYRFSAAEFD